MNTHRISLFAILLCSLLAPGSLPVHAQTGHPRLLLQAGDLPRLRSWASPTNPIYAGGLAVLANAAKMQMDVIDTNNVPPRPNVPYGDTGATAYESFPTEMYAELFAFMSLISTSPADRLDYAQRATNLLG